jgi:hypothetical protein
VFDQMRRIGLHESAVYALSSIGLRRSG